MVEILDPGYLALLREHVGEEFADRLLLAVRQMGDRMLMSAPKYGKVTPEAVADRGWMASIQQRLDKFTETGNTEWLIDVMNFLVMMSTFPCHPNWHFRSTPSDESPGDVRADGTRRFTPDDQGVHERFLRRRSEGD